MAKNASTIGLEADPNDPEDFDVSVDAIEHGLSERRMRGPQRTPTKVAVSLRLDREVLQRFRDEGPGYQARINAVLRKSVGL